MTTLGLACLSPLGMLAGTAVVLGCGLTTGTWHLALDTPGWHSPLCWLSAPGRRLLGTGLAFCSLDGVWNVPLRCSCSTLVQDGGLLYGEGLIPQGIQADVLFLNSSIGGLATVAVHLNKSPSATTKTAVAV